MNFSSVRLVTKDLDTIVEFYTRLFGHGAERPAPGFAEFRLSGATLAISEEDLVLRFNNGAAIAAANRSAILEFEVSDVSAVYSAFDCTPCVVMPPTSMPWGNQSFLIRDPDGNLVNVFSRPPSPQQMVALCTVP